MVQTSLQMDDTEETAWLSLGRIYMKLREYEKAHDAFTFALKLDPDNTYAKEFLKKVGSLLGD